MSDETARDCNHQCEWKTWPERMTEDDLKTGNHGTKCTGCGEELSLETMLAVWVNEESS